MKPFLILIATSLGLGCWGGAQTPAPEGEVLLERIAAEFASASPLADPGDARARDAAAAQLVGCRNFRAAAGPQFLWGGFDPANGYDPEQYRLTVFDPLVWLKLYASTIMFTGEHEVRQDGPYTVLALKARFRSRLDPGDYPYPFWHAHRKWRDYVDLDAVHLVFQGHRLVAGYRIAKSDPARPVAERAFDGQWLWTDAQGNPQPRVSLFNYLFGADNPHRARAEEAYRRFEAKARAQDCHSCHAPDNKGQSKALLMLVYPNQALVGRHALVQTLEDNKMPPEDLQRHHPAGIADAAVRSELLRLARAFVVEADAAVAFESSRTPVAPQSRGG